MSEKIKKVLKKISLQITELTSSMETTTSQGSY